VARRCGAEIDVIPNDEYGQVSVAALRNMIDERVKLIGITHGLPNAERSPFLRKLPRLAACCRRFGESGTHDLLVGPDD